MARTLKSCLGVISLVALLLISGYGTAEALKAHTDSCNTCHRMSGANPRAINSLCLACHISSGSTAAKAAGVFTTTAASNAFNHNGSAGTDAGSQTSHFWGGSKTAYPQAGSQNPPTTFYSSRNAISTGLVTCSICHDPHNDMATTKKLLRTTTATTTDVNDAVCKQCHVAYYIDNPSALLTHPVGPTAVPTADPLKFNTPIVNIGSGNMQYFNGSVSCSSCHSPHFADSNSTTTDGNGQSLVAGDGKLLRTDGPRVTDPDPQIQADRRSAVCTACHPYKTHGNAAESLSCFVCHSVHNPTASTNVFVLRSSVTTATFGTVTGLSYTSVPPLDLTGSTSWADTGATTNGYCEKCHGNLLNTLAGGISESRLHAEGENCRTCHVHHKADATRSFAAAGGCDGCHGYPPSANVVGGPNGYASGYTPFKNEAATPHAAHAAGSGNYSFSCTACHLNNNHNSGSSFQDVFLGADAPIATGNGNMSPTYTATGSGTCANVYCHSNGGARTSDFARTYTAATIPVWTAGSTTGAITTCNACHDNSNAMTNGSAAHAAHLALAGVTCKTCHVTTADSATALATGAIGGTHVNGTINVAFDTSGFITVGATPYTAATGTCAVYCHSNGVSFASPDWDVATSGDCGACHQYSLAGVATGTGTALSATHNKHLYTSAGGVQLACTTCHTNAGSGVDHVNGSASFVVNYQAAVCNLCHGASNGVTVGDDRQPIWNSTASVDCQTCHAGSVTATISSKSAANKSSATSTGHNKASGTYSVSGNVAANKVCSSCHNSAAAGHFDGITGDDMRLLPAAANCTTSCHGVSGSAVKDGIVTHKPGVIDCADCHDPHGSSNIYMVKAASAGNYSGTVAFTALSGTDSYDESDAANGDDICATCHTAANQAQQHNNKTNTGVAHNEGTDCFTCHKSHTETAGAFVAGAGTACNQCHGFPPATNAHRAGPTLSDDELHSTTTKIDDTEDRTDCATCHTGADLYTYSPAADRGSLVSGRLNHGATTLNPTANPTARQIVLTASVGYNVTDKNCTTACHKSSAADGFWADTALNCDACHTVTPTSAANNAGVANAKTGTYQLTGTHNQHFDVSAVCSDCHGTLPTDLTHITANLGNDAAKIIGKAKAEMDEASIDTVGLVATDADPGNATCANIACHNPSNGAYSATWAVTNADCSTCHSATAPATGSHNKHMTAAGTFGINTIACTSCHINNGTNNAHRNGSVNFAAGMNYASNRCSTTICHNDGNGVAVQTPIWGTPSADCTLCHGNAPATGAHASHANTTYVAGSCSECHTAANASTHINGTRNMANKVSVYTAGTQTCTNSCHIANTTGDWTPSGTLACTDCHGSNIVTTPALDRKWPPTSGAHSSHVGNFYVAANCVNCHNDNTTTHSTLNNVVTAISGSKVSSYTVNNCTNTCHVAADANDWTAGTRACVDCHLVGKTGLYDSGVRDQAPTSGLHATTNALAHDDLFGASYTCTNCHNSATPSAAHGTGVLQTSLQTTYTYTAQIASYSNANGCASSCHKDGGTWNRKWIGVVDAAPAYTDLATAAVCKNCHGSFAQGWNYVNELGATTSDHTDPDPDNTGDQMNAGGHAVCSKCHGWGDASYQSGLMHNNNLIAMNSDLGYDNGTGNCTTNCHGGKTLTTNTNSGFTNESGTFGGVGCGSCHDDGTIPPNSGAHSAHGANADGDYSECILCHGDNGGLGFASTTGTHGDLSVTFAAGITYSNGGTPGTNAAADNDTCSTTICHTASGTVLWSATSLGCSECHYYNVAPTTAGNTGINALGGSHSKHFGTGSITTCASCHVVPVAGDTAHINGATNLIDKANATMDEAAVIAAALNTGTNPIGNATCNNIACHNPSNGAYTATWTVANAVGCAFCHSATDPGTGSHNKHVNTFTNGFGIANIPCTSCHVNNGTNNAHRNGTVTFAAGMNYTGGAEDVGGTVGSCNTSTCHNDGTVAQTPVPTTNWGTPSVDCTLCHGNAPNTGAHASHVNATYVAGSCTDCHTAANVSTHINGTRNMANKVSVYSGSPNFTCTNSCHIANTTGDWTPSGALACTDCHGSGKVTTPALDRGFPPASGAHTKHYAETDYVNDPNCTDCHANNIVTHSTLDNNVVVGGNNITIFNADGTCTNNCHLGGDFDTPVALTCANCHDGGGLLDQGTWPPSSFAHAEHLASNALPNATDQNDCYACHGNTINNSGVLTGSGHLNLTAGDLAVSGTFSYEGAAISTGGTAGTGRTCSNVLCHNGTTTPTWGAGAISCGDCHGVAATDDPTPVSASTAGSHALHVDALLGDYSDCAKCHSGADTYSQIGGVNHQNLVVNVSFPIAVDPDSNNNYSDTTEGGVNYQAGDATHVDNGTCSNINCHYNTTVTWGAASQSVPARCDNCHNDGTPDDTLSSSAPNSGWHNLHVNLADPDYVDDCNACHGANASSAAHTGHGNLSLTLNTSVVTAWDATTTKTCTNTCHAAGSGDWDKALSEAAQTGSLTCDDCHAASGKALYVSGALTSTTPPATGKHAKHDASTLTQLASGCTTCHPHSGALRNSATTKHVNGTLATSIDVDGTRITDVDLVTGGNQTQTTAAWVNTCVNTCHSASVGDDNWSGGTLECADCHTGTYIGGNYAASGKHSAHNSTVATSYTATAANNSTAGAYDFNCANCHGTTGTNHMNNVKNVTLADYSAGNCNNNSCHNNGNVGVAANVVANWTTGWVSDGTTDKCDNCHGNSPTSNAHGLHKVGIHYTNLYDHDQNGLMAPSGAAAGSAHGNVATSTTINCNICHNQTVTMARNMFGTTCITCHTSDTQNATNIMDVANKAMHINGAKNVNFADLTTFKSKAQVRDDITTVPELTGSWARSAGSYKKADGTGFDTGKGTASFAGGTCSSIACHNGNPSTWTDTNVSCNYCHVSTTK